MLTDDEISEYVELELDSLIEPDQYKELTTRDLSRIISELPSDFIPIAQFVLDERNLQPLSLDALRTLGNKMLDVAMYDRHMSNEEFMYTLQLGQPAEELSWTVLAKSLAAL